MGFEIFPWDAIRRHEGARDVEQTLRDMKACGFTASCFIEPKDIPLCREIGLDPITFLYAERNASGGTDEFRVSGDGRMNASLLVSEGKAVKEEIEAEVERALSELDDGHSKVYIVDEPGTGCFERMRWFADTVRRCRPDLDLYINLFPNYAVCGKPDLSQLEADTYEEYLEKYCVTFPDIPMSVDNYRILMGMDNQKQSAQIGYYRNLIQCREACDRYGNELHYVVNSNQLRAELTIPTLENLMLQAFTVLAVGARSLAWYTYFGRNGYYYAPVDDSTDEDIRTPVWYLLREVNRRVLSMGNELYEKKYKGMYFSDTMEIPRAKHIAACPEIKGFTSDLPCMVGVYEDSGEPVVMVVNMSLEHSTRVEIDLGGELVWWSNECNKYIKPLTGAGSGRKPTPTWLAPGDALLVKRMK